MNIKTLPLSPIDSEDFSFYILELEKSLAVQFSEDAFEHIETVGDLMDVVCTKVDAQNLSGCTSQKAFYKIRCALIQEEIAVITPKTPLKPFFSEKGREKNWVKLGQKLQLELPPLDSSCLTLFIMFISFTALFFSVEFRSNILSILFASVGFIAFLFYSLMPKSLPVKSIGELAESITKLNYAKISKGIYNRNEIEKMIWQELECYYEDDKY